MNQGTSLQRDSDFSSLDITLHLQRGEDILELKASDSGDRFLTGWQPCTKPSKFHHNESTTFVFEEDEEKEVLGSKRRPQFISWIRSYVY